MKKQKQVLGSIFFLFRLFAPVFQDYQLFAYTIRENLVFDGEYHKAEAEALLAELGLDKKKAACRME